MPTVLVTGATGFVGLAAVRQLQFAGFEVHALARKEREMLPPGCRFHALDLFESTRVTEFLCRVKPEYLLHLAWTASPPFFWTAPANRDWVPASLHLLEAFAHSGGRRAVIAGTCAEYDWTSAGRCHETITPVRPTTLYGQCKNALRTEAEEMGDRLNLSLAWGRIFFLYGPREHPGRLVPSVVKALLKGDPAPCSAGFQQRDFLHVDDAAGALISLLLSNARGPCNIGSGEPISVRQVVETIAAKIGRPDLLKLGEFATPENEPLLLFADATRLRGEVGWVPHYSLSEGLTDTIAWWSMQ